MKKIKWPVLYGLGLAGFTAFLAVHTFVLPQRYQTEAVEENISMFEGLTETAQAAEVETSDGNSGDDEGISGDDDNDFSDESNNDDVENSDPSGDSGTDHGNGSHERPSRGEGGPGHHGTGGDEQSSYEGSGSGNHSHSGHGKRDAEDIADGSGSDEGSAAADETDSDGTSDTALTPSTLNAGDSQTISTDNADITVTTYYENDTKIYVADITLDSAQYLKTAFAEDTYGKNITEKTSVIAAEKDAVLAINGDFYGARESGIVIRNGIIYRDEADENDVLCIYADGSMKVIEAGEMTAEEMISDNVWQAFTFGPSLITNGTLSVSENDEVDHSMSSNPRTAIGLISENHFVFVVSDGRTEESEGLSLYELAEFMKELGCETAYNLDGGGSSTMYFNGAVINNPTTTGTIKERQVSDIVYIGE